ncbi:MAG: iron ABC transporter permease [Methanomassiliicoccales archaeon]|nr:MAG: iron ABC transporter permease [Methanomassiliicoccales archaeon]QLH75635.1 MAG: iron ABC transporter permease [Methanomassiliicoccales archaeon]
MIFMGGCFVLMLLLMGVSLSIGSAGISVFEAYAAIFDRFLPDLFDVSWLANTVVWQLRLPRTLMAVAAGAILAIAGCSTQGILHNPLATPYTLGVSASAGFGAAIGIILGHGLFEGSLLVIGNAFLFSLIPAFVILLASRRIGMSPETMILCGVAMAYIFSASNTLLQFFAEADAMKSTVFWMVGDLARSAWWQLPYVFATLTIFILIVLFFAKDISIIKMGDDSAKGLGVEVERVRTIIIMAACLSTAVIVSFTGAIGFICLLAPHIARLVIGSEERYLLPASALGGSCLMLFADIIARTAAAPVMLPVGAITALLGGPLLIYLLLRQRGYHL